LAQLGYRSRRKNMYKIACAALIAIAVSAVTTARDAHSQGGTMPDPAAAEIAKELAPSGTLRAAINFGNPVLAQRDANTREPGGVTVDLARELARRLNVALELVPFEAAGKVFEALKNNGWDIAFLAIEPVRAAEIAFSAPYVIIEGVYLVPQNSKLRRIDEVDREGVRIGVNKGSAYDLFLTRTLKHAQLHRGENGIELFRKEGLEAAAGVKQPLVEYAKNHPDVRVMDGRFMEIRQAVGTPRVRLEGREAVPHYLHAFVEEMKASGFIAQALARSNQPDAAVAPAEK
jgi:polar amino acid transport system substrate-binding protein